MKNDHPQNRRDAAIKEENEFLKIKMMLENGAQFHAGKDLPPIDPRLENKFLHHMMEFERQFAQHKTVTVFEKIKKPKQFVPVGSIPDENINDCWESLYQYMLQHGIELSVCSPNVHHRELYRFATEELFLQEIDDINIDGMTCNFIYDDFYPDHKYDNTRAALEDCISCILSKKDFEWMHHFRKDGLQLNNYFDLTEMEFKNFVQRFQSSFGALLITKLKELSCEMVGNNCRVNGSYKASAKRGEMRVSLEGTWMVEFELDTDFGYWQIINVQIGGVQF